MTIKPHRLQQAAKPEKARTPRTMSAALAAAGLLTCVSVAAMAPVLAQELDPLFEPTRPSEDPFADDPFTDDTQPADPNAPFPPDEQDDPNEVLDLDTGDFSTPQQTDDETLNPEFESNRIPVEATLRALDKITAKTKDITIAVDGTASFERLDITLRTCNKRPPEEPPEVTAFLEVTENALSGETSSVFTGWMFASSPGLSAMEHSVYDVWVIDCKMTDPETDAPEGASE